MTHVHIQKVLSEGFSSNNVFCLFVVVFCFVFFFGGGGGEKRIQIIQFGVISGPPAICH